MQELMTMVEKQMAQAAQAGAPAGAAVAPPAGAQVGASTGVEG
jgi:hypothetical protein